MTEEQKRCGRDRTALGAPVGTLVVMEATRTRRRPLKPLKDPRRQEPAPESKVGPGADLKTGAKGLTASAVETKVHEPKPETVAASEHAPAMEALLDSRRSKRPVRAAPPSGLSNMRLQLMALSRSADIVLEARPTVVDAHLQVPNPDLAVAAGGVAVAAFCEPLLKDQIVTKHYDSQIFVNRFLDHRERQLDKSPVAAFGSFEASAGKEAAEGGASHCVGLAIHLVDDLRKRGVQAFVAPALLPPEMVPKGSPPYAHALAMVPFQNPDAPKDRGVVLLDPGLNLATPIVVRATEPTVLELGGQRWEFRLDEARGEVAVLRSTAKGQEGSTFLVREWTNPDEALTRSAPATYTKLKRVVRDDDGGVLAASVIDLDKREITLMAAGQRVRVGFDDLEGLERQCSEAFTGLFGEARTSFIERIRQIVRYEDDLADLRTTKGGV